MLLTLSGNLLAIMGSPLPHDHKNLSLAWEAPDSTRATHRTPSTSSFSLPFQLFEKKNICLFIESNRMTWIVMCVLSCFSHVQLCETLWAVAHQAPLSMRFSRKEYWSGLPCPPGGDLPNPGVEPMSPPAPALQVDSSSLTHWGSPCSNICAYYKHIKYQGLILGLRPCTISQW